MTFPTYLKSHWFYLLAALLAAGICVCILLEVGVSQPAIILVCIAIISAVLLAVVFDYRRKATFWKELAKITPGKSHPAWYSEVVQTPDTLEEKITYEAVAAFAKAANDEIALHRRHTQDYQEYVETWVHEAKSPLAAAHLMLENMVDGVPATQAGEALLTKVQSLNEDLDRVENYIEQALFFARSESFDRDYLIRSYDLSQLVGDAIRANARLLMAAHVTPSCIELEQTVFTDEKWLLFILGQLIQNAVKYAKDADAHITFSATLQDKDLANERVELEVRDNGFGVTASELPRVFDRGFTGTNGRTNKRSTGIGLYLVKRLCDKMGLHVSAASQEDEFFAVTISFATNKMHYFDD